MYFKLSQGKRMTLLQLNNEIMIHIAIINKMLSQSMWEQDFPIFTQLYWNVCNFLNKKLFFAKHPGNTNILTNLKGLIFYQLPF